jgi:hypothetical protein
VVKLRDMHSHLESGNEKKSFVVLMGCKGILSGGVGFMDYDIIKKIINGE